MDERMPYEGVAVDESAPCEAARLGAAAQVGPKRWRDLPRVEELDRLMTLRRGLEHPDPRDSSARSCRMFSHDPKAVEEVKRYFKSMGEFNEVFAEIDRRDPNMRTIPPGQQRAIGGISESLADRLAALTAAVHSTEAWMMSRAASHVKTQSECLKEDRVNEAAEHGVAVTELRGAAAELRARVGAALAIQPDQQRDGFRGVLALADDDEPSVGDVREAEALAGRREGDIDAPPATEAP